MMLCSFVGGNEYSGGICCICLHYRRVSWMWKKVVFI